VLPLYLCLPALFISTQCSAGYKQLAVGRKQLHFWAFTQVNKPLVIAGLYCNGRVSNNSVIICDACMQAIYNFLRAIWHIFPWPMFGIYPTLQRFVHPADTQQLSLPMHVVSSHHHYAHAGEMPPIINLGVMGCALLGFLVYTAGMQRQVLRLSLCW